MSVRNSMRVCTESLLPLPIGDAAAIHDGIGLLGFRLATVNSAHFTIKNHQQPSAEAQ
jgi:hypothetical protein